MGYTGAYATGYFAELSPYQFVYQDGGILLNDDALPSKPFVDIVRVSGLDNAPFRTTERDREGMDGGFADAEFEKSRTIVLEGTVYGPHTELYTYMESLKNNYAPVNQPQPFYFQPPSTSRRVVFCKSYGCKYDIDQAWRIGSSPIQLQLFAEDPTIYDDPTTQVSCSLPIEGTGRGYDKSYDYGYGGPNSGGSLTWINSGNRPGTGTIIITGPIINPVITHDTSGSELEFNITIAAGQTLTVELRDHTVLLNGTANRRSALVNTSRWFLLQPGANSLRFGGTDPGGTTDPTMTLLARGAYR